MRLVLQVLQQMYKWSGQGIADSTTEVSGAKHEAVRSNWLDRTDIAVGVQSGGASDSHKEMFPSAYIITFIIQNQITGISLKPI